MSEVVPGVASARRNGTGCYYVTPAGDNALAVDIPPVYNDDPIEAIAQLVAITMQFDASFDPTGQGCDEVDLGTAVEGAYHCTRSAADEPATLVLRLDMIVVQLIDVVPSSPPDRARLVTLALTLVPRLP